MSYKSTVIALNPSWFWPVTEDNPNTDVLKSLTMSLVGGTTAVENPVCGPGSGGGYGYYWAMDGANEYAQGPDDDALTLLDWPWTLACGFYQDSGQSAGVDYGMLFMSSYEYDNGGWSGVWVSAPSDGSIYVGHGNGTGNVGSAQHRFYTDTSVFDHDEWNHLVIGMADVDTPYGWLNGQALTFSNESGTATTVGVTLSPGDIRPTFMFGHNDGAGDGAIGRLSKPAIWESALDGSEAAALWTAWAGELGNGLAVCPRPLYTRVPSDHADGVRAQVPANYSPGTYNIRVPDNWG